MLINEGIIMKKVKNIVIYAIISSIFLCSFSVVSGGFNPKEPEYVDGYKWQFRYDQVTGGVDLVMILNAELVGETTIDVEGSTYEVYEMSMEGYIESAVYPEMEGIQLTFVEGSSSIKGTSYQSKDFLLDKQIMNMEFQFLEATTGLTMDFEIVSTSITTDIATTLPDEVDVGSTWNITEVELETVSTTFSGALFDVIEPGYTNTTTSTTTTTTTKSFECLSEIKMTVDAGTFDTYEMRTDYEEDGTYELDYFSVDVFHSIKNIKYNVSGEIESTIELASYDFSLSSGSSEDGTPGFEILILMMAVSLVVIYKKRRP